MNKILAIATSDATKINGKKTGLWLSELTHFLDEVERAGFAYDIASPKGGKIPLDEQSSASIQKDPVNAKYMADKAFVDKLEHSMKCSDIDASQYVAIYLAGGHGTMFDFRQSPDLQKLITEFSAQNKFLSGVCHGVAGFVDAVDGSGNLLVKGRVVTGYSNIEDTLGGARKFMPFLLEDELKRNGARYKKNFLPFTERVESDGRLITGQNPQSAKAVGETLAGKLQA